MASPNNPTGTVASREELLQIAATAPDAALLVDEAYFEFHGETVVGDIERCGNLFVARTFSKAYGMAGLRVGILAGPRQQMPQVRRVSSPYSVNAVALAVLPVALADRDHLSCYVAQVKNGRERLALELKTLEAVQLAQPGKLSASQDWAKASRIRWSYAAARNSGTRSLHRSRL